MLLLTNSGEASERAALRAALPQLVEYDLGAVGLPTGWAHAQHHSIVEQILGSTADAFLAGPHHFARLSTFARVVVEERELAGRVAGSTYFMQPRERLFAHVEYGSALTAELVEGEGGVERVGRRRARWAEPALQPRRCKSEGVSRKIFRLRAATGGPSGPSGPERPRAVPAAPSGSRAPNRTHLPF